jgi:two-component system sensor kinase FixL
MADAVQLEQVLVNLVSNSIQAIDAAGMSRREVHIAVAGIEHRDPAGRSSPAAGRAAAPGPTAPPAPGMIRITIRDTGPGLPQANAEQLFNIFKSTRGSGLGLGLAISRDIVEAHGGRLWAETTPPEGACLHFTIPSADDGGA